MSITNSATEFYKCEIYHCSIKDEQSDSKRDTTHLFINFVIKGE